MDTTVSLYSNKEGEILRFLRGFHKGDVFDYVSKDTLEWKFKYSNPIEIADIIGSFIENNDVYDLSMWVSLDSGVCIHVTDDNADDLIRYLFERYPY